jgi:hypothetical protein
MGSGSEKNIYGSTTLVIMTLKIHEYSIIIAEDALKCRPLKSLAL